MGRAQTEVIAVVLLVGFVLVAAGSVFVVGSAALSPLEEQSEHEQNVEEAQQIAHEIETLMRSSNGDADVALREGYDVSEDGAEITITVDDDQETEIETGQLERDGIVYEGGLIVDDESGQVLNSPPFELRNGSSHMQFPTLQSESGQFDGALEQTNVDSIDTPEERLEIEIESAYYEQWADQFDNADEIDENDEEETVTIVYDFSPPESTSYAMGLGSDEGTAVELNDLPETEIYSYEESPNDPRANAIFAVYIDEEENQNQGGDIDIYGFYKYDDDGAEPQTYNENNGGGGNVDIYKEYGEDEQRPPENTTIDNQTATADFLLDSVDQEYTEYEGGDQDLEGGIYVSDDDVNITSATAKEESILVVKGNLTVGESDELLDEEGELIHEERGLTVDDNLDLHVHGNLTIEDGATLGNEDFDATRMTAFVDGDVILGNGDIEEENAELTGLVYATHSTLYTEDTAIVNGGVIVQQLTAADHHNHDKLSIRFDERLEDQRTPYAVEGDAFETPDRMNENRPEIHDFDIRISEIDTE